MLTSNSNLVIVALLVEGRLLPVWIYIIVSQVRFVAAIAMYYILIAWWQCKSSAVHSWTAGLGWRES
jgi:hypothetical protein